MTNPGKSLNPKQAKKLKTGVEIRDGGCF